MIDAAHAEDMLRHKYPDLQAVRAGVYRCVDRHNNLPYAVRYFDLNDSLADIAPSLKAYQEELLSGGFFSHDAPTDLRWNHYLYFVASEAQAKHGEFRRTKAVVES